MEWFLYLISLLWIAAGAWMILYTHESRNAMSVLIKGGVDRRIISVLPVVVGILLLFAASSSRHSWVIRLFGFMAVLKGGFIFWNPKNLYEKTTNWCLNAVSDQTYRLFGIITLIFGTVILSWIL